MDQKKLIADKLLAWENGENPLAPLTSIQEESIRLLSSVPYERPLPKELPIDDGVFLVPPHLLVKESKESDLQLGGTVIGNLQEFLSWYSSVEDKLLEDDEMFYKMYVEELMSYRNQCSNLLNNISVALELLELLQNKYMFVSNKTNALHEACEHLLAEQTNLVNSAESISEKLCYFNELEVLSQKVASPTLSVVNESFVPLLARLDECISYLEANKHFKEAGVYLARFRHLQNLALGMIRSYVITTMQNATQQVLSKRDVTTTAENAFTLYYGKYRSHAPRVKSLMKQIEERIEKYPDYQHLLSDCHQCYFNQREILLGPSVTAAINELASNHQRDHCSLVRSGCAFLLHVCEDEYQLFQQFFSQHSKRLQEFLESLCLRLYDVLRPIIIHINHLETLAELCGILKVEMLEEHMQYGTHELEAFRTIVHQMLEDVQERLVYRTLVYMKTDILNYNPASGDLAYPEKLEMMECIAESLAAGNLSRSSSQLSIGSTISVGSSVFTPNVSAVENVHCDKNHNKADSVSEAEIADSAGEEEQTQPSIEQSKIHRTRSITYSPADMHGMWYPTVRRTLVCLSKLYRCLDRTIFQGLSQEVLTACIQSLISASSVISKKKTPLDGQLFQIKHLLILREQIDPFQIDFAIKETTLDFSNVKGAAYGLFQNKSHILSFNSSNAILELIIQGAPHVKERLIDSKKAVDKQLKVICEEFISATTSLFISPMQEFLEKAKVIVQLQQDEKTRNVCLSSQPFASAEKVSQLFIDSFRLIKTKVPIVQRSMSLYLANRDTEYILFRPVKTRIQNCLEQIIQLIRVNYTEEEQAIIACPSPEQVSLLLSSDSDKF